MARMMRRVALPALLIVSIVAIISTAIAIAQPTPSLCRFYPANHGCVRTAHTPCGGRQHYQVARPFARTSPAPRPPELDEGVVLAVAEIELPPETVPESI